MKAGLQQQETRSWTTRRDETEPCHGVRRARTPALHPVKMWRETPVACASALRAGNMTSG
jgi:hypothetical protein